MSGARRLSVRLSQLQLDRLRERCQQVGLDTSYLVRQALDEFLGPALAPAVRAQMQPFCPLDRHRWGQRRTGAQARMQRCGFPLTLVASFCRPRHGLRSPSPARSAPSTPAALLRAQGVGVPAGGRP